MAGLAALFLAMCVESVFDTQIETMKPMILAVAVVGSVLSLFVIKTNFRRTQETDVTIVAERANVLLIFAVVIVSMNIVSFALS